MAQIKYIKHLREREGKSIQAIADTLNIDWRTAKKYADCEDFNLPPRRKRRKPVMDPYETIPRVREDRRRHLVAGRQEHAEETEAYSQTHL